MGDVEARAEFLEGLLAVRLEPAALEQVRALANELAAGAGSERLAALVALVSRHVRRAPLEPSAAERARAAQLQEGWDPERWDVLDVARALLVLSLAGVEGAAGEEALEAAFRYADVGEQVALYRALPLLPAPERFTWRLGEGARSNMRAVFEAACCDSPFPARHFDDVAWRSAVLKCLFVGAPLWRVQGLDGRLDEELARMALDFADERRSAGREVPAELWLCLGAGADRGRARSSIAREQESAGPRGRAAAALALARAGDREGLAAALAREEHAGARAIISAASEGRSDQRAFAALADLPA